MADTPAELRKLFTQTYEAVAANLGVRIGECQDLIAKLDKGYAKCPDIPNSGSADNLRVVLKLLQEQASAHKSTFDTTIADCTAAGQETMRQFITKHAK